MKIIRLISYFPFVLPAVIIYLLLGGERKKRLNLDLDRYMLRDLQGSCSSRLTAFYRLMVNCRAFRGVFYMRAGKRKSLLCPLPAPANFMVGMNPDNIEGGLYVEHGWCTGLCATHIGRNLWVNQVVTIGWTEKGAPELGDNVRIGTGAVVLGPIKIGDNVDIGANAIVVDDIPSNCTVCSPKSRIVKVNNGDTENATRFSSAQEIL